MAKDGTNRGGRRTRAGDKPQPLIDKITNGKAAKILNVPDLQPESLLVAEELTEAAQLHGEDIPLPGNYLSTRQKDGKPLGADTLFIETWKWLKGRGCEKFVNPRLVEAYVLPTEKTPFCHQRYVSYIFNEDEISQIINTAEKLDHCRYANYYYEVIPMVFRTLYGCGLRTMEIRNLKLQDVDLENGILTVWKSKNSKDRIVPMSDGLTKRMRIYFERIRILEPTTEWLFPKHNAKKLGTSIIYHWFRKLLKEAEIPHYGKGKGPRVHDFRHTFAVHSLKQMDNNGIDLYVGLPILSSYLGHSSISATEKYLRMTAQIHAEILEKTDNIYGAIIQPIPKEHRI